MKHVGIICEYNPFHTGHARLLKAVRGANTVVCLMSGNFTQRGEAAILPPVPRAAMALACGADLVLELPFPFSASSARYFATAGVRALGSLGIDTLAFGSECGDIEILSALAARAPEGEYRKKAPHVMQNTGDAAAYFAALGETVSSNDILAVEYLRAIAREAPDMEPFVVNRKGAEYRQTVLKNEEYPSATALRESLRVGEGIKAHIPFEAREIFTDAAARYGIADTARLGSALLAVLRANGTGNPHEIAECGGGLHRRLQKAAWSAGDYGALCKAAATKRYTDGRIRRALLYLLAGVKKEDLVAHPVYLRLLAANARGREFLNETMKRRTVHVVTKQADIAGLGACAARQRELSLRADGLYALCFADTVTPHALQTAKPYLL
ncbi:MAG: nucleotidyltransferase family protein [Clostridia bacterium]|nr:nucleotidyltransferase family protein [Clostridia bacterium]MBR3862490.1 nucleotidyltransferase family protein [Clostridia bacterium]